MLLQRPVATTMVTCFADLCVSGIQATSHTNFSTALHMVSPRVPLHAMLQGEPSFCMRLLFALVGTFRRTGDAAPVATTMMVTCFRLFHSSAHGFALGSATCNVPG